ncbi:MAG: UDP-glucose 4-epimerase GalE [Gammaproteobacteria bacterium]|nr:UDP-glucose 4-epimerase GalE [Gammaproteobacteria bacterium]
MRVLVTGGAGYIGSHTVVELLASGHELVILDNLANSSPLAVEAVRRITKRDVPLVRGDVTDGDCLDTVFGGADFDAVIHFAALKAVGESVADPLRYFRNNVAGTATLLDRMAAHDVKAIVFSSSAAVYGDPASVPIAEDEPTRPASPYARSKAMAEDLLRDLHAADSAWRISVLRYFNAVGAHPSGHLGEDPMGTPPNLLPYVAQVAMGQRDCVPVFGDDYATADGTGVRDYLHVCDLARGHLLALEYLAAGPRFALHNLGTGRGSSVYDVIHAFERACGRALPTRIVGRRPGDVVVSIADPRRANADLDWQPVHDLDDCCRDMWRWCQAHPNGFGG